MSPSPSPAPSFTAANLAALTSAIQSANGATEVRFQDRTVRFNTVKEMLLLQTAMYNAVYPGNGTTPGPTRQYRMRTGTGMRW
jgi:hypothetical protein